MTAENCYGRGESRTNCRRSFRHCWRIVLVFLEQQEMVAGAHASRPFAGRDSYRAGAEFSDRALHLHAVLGPQCAEASLAELESNRSRRGNFSGAGLAHTFLRGASPSIWPLCAMVHRPLAN